MGSFTGSLTAASITLTATNYFQGYSPISVAEADTYLWAYTYTDWDSKTEAEKLKLLVQSGNHLDKLRYKGYRYSDTQPFAWPRKEKSNATTSWAMPDDIKKAHAHEAAERAKANIDWQLETLGVKIKSESLGKIGAEYDNQAIPEYLRAGLASYEAWLLLKPYLKPPQGFRFERQS